MKNLIGETGYIPSGIVYRLSTARFSHAVHLLQGVYYVMYCNLVSYIHTHASSVLSV